MKLACTVFVVAFSSFVRADQYCTGNACAALLVTYTDSCHEVTNTGSQALYFTWGQFSGNLQPGQTDKILGLGGECVQYVFGGRTAVYIVPAGSPPPPPSSPPASYGPGPAFRYLGELYGQANQGGPEFNQRKYLPVNLDTGKQIDTSYHQATVQCCGGGATSPLKASQIPAGFYVEIVGGDVYYSIANPELANGQFSMQLYCGPQPPPGAGCNVRVGVWVKQR